MFKIYVSDIFFILYCEVCFSSCTLFKPLPLEPVKNKDSVQKIERTDLSKFTGCYQILSVDSSSTQLDYALTNKSIFSYRNSPNTNDYINILAIDDRHLKAMLFVNDKIVKSTILKGDISDNYFRFHTSRFSLKYIFILWLQQTNRISLSKEEDLFLDTNHGGIGFLLVMPIPLSGSFMDTYNLKFKRRITTD
jgi:hypothetical protein